MKRTNPHPEVQLLPVKSSNIKSIGYHENSGTLHVVFHDGTHWTYDHVPPGKYERLMNSPSKGKFFHTEVKGKHQSTKLS
jgi:hypothetical protein